MSNISAVVLVKNAALTIDNCLSSLSDFGEVVVVIDNDTTDETRFLCSKYSNVSIYHTTFKGFGLSKQFAVSCATKDWIFSLDADEKASPQLLSKLTTLTLKEDTCYAILRHNLFKGRHINACGWDHDYPLRIFNRKTTNFSDKPIHEAVLTQGLKVVKLNEPIVHFAYESTEQLKQKALRYARLFADENYRKKSSSLLKAFLKSSFTFFKDYILRKGWWYGYDGLTIARYNAYGNYLKYKLLAEQNQDLDISLIVSTYNRPEALKVVLESIVHQQTKPKQVIVADDGSTEDTRALVLSYENLLPNLTHVWQEDDGFRLAAIRNKALHAATGRFISMIDGDMVLHSDFLKTITSLAQKKVFLQGKRVLLGSDVTEQLITGKRKTIHFFSRDIINRFNTISLPLLSKYVSRRYPSIKSVKGCSMHFWKEDAVNINGFNEAFIGWGREDSEFLCRMLHSGVIRKNIVLGAVAYHLYHAEADRKMLPENDKILAACTESSLTWCERGLLDKQQIMSAND